jgi:acyl-CoA synthetase (AMP-forming)/AMP-acid ligase II
LKQGFNIGEMIVAAADKYSDRIAFKLPDGAVSYGQFRDMIFSHASRMGSLGVNRESRVAIDVAHPASQICIAMACSLLGCCWVNGSKEALANDAVGITCLVHTGSKARPGGTYASLVVDRSWLPGVSTVQRPEFEGFASPSSICTIIQSSGTTGTPKFMAILASAMQPRIDSRSYDYLGETAPVLASLISLLLALGFNSALKALLLGGTIVISRDLPFLASAAVNTVIGSPVQLLNLCDRSPSLDRKIKCAVLSGARSTDELLNRIFEKFELVQNQFGCSELGVMAFRRLSVVDPNRRSVGRAVPTCKIEIVDADDRCVSANTEGVVRVRTATPILAYLGDEATDTIRDGWFYPGDTGILTDTGELIITGRVNDVVNFGGAKLNAAAIDDVILGTQGVKDGVCFAQSDFSPVQELGVLLVPAIDDEAENVVSRVQANLHAKFGNKGLANRIYVADVIPRNAAGKIPRQDIARMLARFSPFAVRTIDS